MVRMKQAFSTGNTANKGIGQKPKTFESFCILFLENIHDHSFSRYLNNNKKKILKEIDCQMGIIHSFQIQFLEYVFQCF